MESVEKILDVLRKSEEPMRPGQIAEKAGIEDKEVSKLIKKLKDEDLVFSPKRCFYSAK
ncbi:MAG: ArsR family transcriptional regulator [Bacteroidales bacterium]|nr:ArsR family transcriptional regulator [Bacteroidales bacterium]